MASVDHATYGVSCEFRTKTTVGQWDVVAFRLREELDSPFLLSLTLVTRDQGADPMALWGQDCRVVVRRGDVEKGLEQRAISGRISQVELGGGVVDGQQLCSVRVVPALTLLAHTTNSRIFQDKKIPEIIAEVLDGALEPYGREPVDVSQLDLAAFPEREYTVQYHESDRDFVFRLLEQEGICYRFDHGAPSDEFELEKLILSNDTSDWPAGQPLEYLDHASPDPHVGAFDWTSALTTTHVALRDYNWTKPDSPVEGESGQADLVGARRAQVLYQQGTAISQYGEDIRGYQSHDAARQASLREQLHRSGQQQGQGQSSAFSLAAGSKFVLTGHPVSSLNREYLVVAVEHQGEVTPGHDFAGSYENVFRCIPVTAPFRPRRITPVPRVYGCQVATVVGPEGEEIHTDTYGRVRVRFLWDRRARQDVRCDDCSCWIRVAQSWAGQGFGASFIPRVGMDVVVQFEDGDPDRPLVTGCVYNGQNPPPLRLPEDKTQSTITTHSSPDGEDKSNKLTFEDKKGAEFVHLLAQRDLTEEVLNNHSTTVEADQTNDVKGKHTVIVGHERAKTVGLDETNTLKGNRTTTITKNDTFTVTEDRDATVHGKLTETVVKDHQVTARANQFVDVDLDRRDSVGQNYDIFVDSRFQVNHAHEKAVFEMKGGTIELLAAQGIELKTGAASMKLKPDGTIELQGVTLMVRGQKDLQLVGANASSTFDKQGILSKGKAILGKGSKKAALQAGKVKLG